ncbi:MAG: CDP-glycerol glycerophosphotransferase family protein [Methanobrevibacter sp.]|nr:CDP-glycerol glycerophosphotransferase family protein [Methanobrevibacter sp.]
MPFKIAVVMAVYNKRNYISQAIDSIINQSFGFKKNIQLILVNDKSTDGTLDILERYQERYPENITLINNDKNMGSAYSRNRGLEHVDAKYVNFLDSDDYMSKDAFKRAYGFLEKYWEVNIVSIPIHYFGVKRGPHNLNFKYEKNQLVNVVTSPDHIQLSGASAFFRYEKLKKYAFNENLRVSEDALLINQMLLENPLLGFLSKPRYYYRKDGTQNSLITSSASTKSYFTSRIEEYFLNLIDYAREKTGEVPDFIQHVLMYDLQWIFEIDKIDGLLSEEEIKTLYDRLIEILKMIDEKVILDQKSIPAALKAHVILIKRYGWDYLNDKTNISDNFKLNALFIDNFAFLNDHEVKIDGMLTNFTKDTEIIAEIDGEDVPTQTIRYPQRDNYSLNFNYGFNHCFRVTLPFRADSRISFKTKSTSLKIEYAQTSRLNDVSRFKLSKSHIAIAGSDEIIIADKSVPSALKLELKTLVQMIRDRSQGWVTGAFIRALSIVSYPFLRNRRIWLFMDLPNAAGDNALELFKYVSSIETDAKTYFVLEKSFQEEYDYMTSSPMQKIKRLLGFGKSSGQFAKLQKIGNVLAYRSIKHRLFTLFSEFIITSHPDNTIIYPFWGNYEYLSGILRSKTVFLQHGVTKDNVSEWLNEFDKPLALLSCVSDAERESFKNPDYGYSHDIIKTLGFPRFDRLEDDNKKEIVLMPSWRRQFDQLSPSDFVKTNFYKIFNELLTDDELIEFARENGYTLVFKPHRNLHKFIDAFTRHPDVNFDMNLENYTETFNRAALIITDYSSIAFDIAYMKKPLIYYQFDNSYHFNVEEAYFQYERDGFGPVAKTHEELKGHVIKLIEKGCVMDEVYQKRVDDFFKYNDRNNSKRVYEEICRLDTYY